MLILVKKHKIGDYQSKIIFLIILKLNSNNYHQFYKISQANKRESKKDLRHFVLKNQMRVISTNINEKIDKLK